MWMMADHAGDLVWVENGVLPCDLVLLRGEAIVDENMLTGEAVPVRKTSYSPESSASTSYLPDVQKDCTLFGGTLAAQCRPATGDPAPLAMVSLLASMKMHFLFWYS